MGCVRSKRAESPASNAAAGGPNADASAKPTAGADANNVEKLNAKLLDNYVLGAVLGQGAFGVVYSCKKKTTVEEYAVKLIDKVESPMSDIKREVQMLQMLAHPCVVKLHAVFYEKVFVYLVMDVYKGGDLIGGMQAHWKAKGQIPVANIQIVAKQMMESIAWLHSKNVVHRDIKGDNYLMDIKQIEDPKVRVYLSDFGTVIKMNGDERLTQSCGTKVYWSPEFCRLSYGLKVDVWAVGIVMFGLFSGKFPFKGEPEIKNKEIVVNTRAPRPASELLLAILTKDEKKRFTAQQAVDHPWFAALPASYPTQTAEDKEMNFQPEMKEREPNAGVTDRRRELVERLGHSAASKPHALPFAIIKESFSVTDGAKVFKYEWWPAAQCESQGLTAFPAAKKASEQDMQADIDTSTDGIKDQLQQHNISISAFGKDKAKTLPEFVNEIQNGLARLMLDATQHKKIVRVVDIVLLRIRYTGPGGTKFLIKTSETLADGRSRDDLVVLPGTKKEPAENSRQVAIRVVDERLNMADSKIKYYFQNREEFEDSEMSPSYPGVLTVYRKEIVDCVISTTDATILKRIGAQDSSEYQSKDTRGVGRTFRWMDEKECKQHNVKIRAPKEAGEISALVHPPIGLDQEALSDFLRSQGVDPELFGENGTKTLKEFSEELTKGEATLSKQGGTITRVVDVVVMKIVKPNGDVLVSTEEVVNGQSKKLERLPAAKRRSDENQFLAAHRVITKVLQMDETYITIIANEVKMVEEEAASTSYPGVKTFYRKRVVTARLEEN